MSENFAFVTCDSLTRDRHASRTPVFAMSDSGKNAASASPEWRLLAHVDYSRRDGPLRKSHLAVTGLYDGLADDGCDIQSEHTHRVPLDSKQ